MSKDRKPVNRRPDRRTANREPEEAVSRKSASDFYKLNTKAIDDLVNADETNSPEVSKEELRKYQSHSSLRIADWVKILFIKAWFPGSMCFFFIWGLMPYVPNQLDIMFIVGVAMGIVTDLLTNNVLTFFEKEPGDYRKWIMVNKGGVVGFMLNILYAFVVVFFVFTLYRMINAVLTGGTTEMPLGVGPILFGLFYLGFDLMFIGMKHLLASIVKDAKEKAFSGRPGKKH